MCILISIALDFDVSCDATACVCAGARAEGLPPGLGEVGCECAAAVRLPRQLPRECVHGCALKRVLSCSVSVPLCDRARTSCKGHDPQSAEAPNLVWGPGLGCWAEVRPLLHCTCAAESLPVHGASAHGHTHDALSRARAACCTRPRSAAGSWAQQAHLYGLREGLLPCASKHVCRQAPVLC